MLGTHCSLTSRCVTSAAGLYLTVSHKRDINIYICCTMGGLSNKATVCGTAAVGLRGGGAGRSVGLGGGPGRGERSWKGKGRSGAWGGSWRWGRGPGRSEIVGGGGERSWKGSRRDCAEGKRLWWGREPRGGEEVLEGMWGRGPGGGGEILEGGVTFWRWGESSWKGWGRDVVGGTRPYRGELLGAVGAAGAPGRRSAVTARTSGGGGGGAAVGASV